jgi:hypothetical protein
MSATASKQKTTPAIKRATQNLNQSLVQLQGFDLCDLQQRLQANCLNADQRLALAAMLDNLYQLVQAEALRQTAGYVFSVRQR